MSESRRDDSAAPPDADGGAPSASGAKKPAVPTESIAAAVAAATASDATLPAETPAAFVPDIEQPTLPGVGPGAPPAALLALSEAEPAPTASAELAAGDAFSAPAIAPLAAPQALPAATPAPASAPSADAAVAPAEPDGKGAGPASSALASEPPTMPFALLAQARNLGEQADGIRIRLFGQTDVGLVREHNEDNFLIADLARGLRGVTEETCKHMVEGRGSVFAVCDGMGGAAAGEVASQMAVDTIYERMQAGATPHDRDEFARRLVHSIEEAGARIFTAAKLDRTRRGMGTTSTVAGLIDKVLFVGQVGDSRAYVLRGNSFVQITKDQSLVNQLIEAGQLTEEEAEAFEHSNIILQALGTAEQVHVDLTFLELRRGDRLILCSDGLSGLVHADLMKDVLLTTAAPEACCARLIEMARNGGGHDNITVVVVDFDGLGVPEPLGTDGPSYMQYPLPPGELDPRESAPPRETSIKTATVKPGADVKRADKSSGRPPAPEQAPVVAPPASRRWMIILALIIAIVATAVVLAMSGVGADTGSDRGVGPDVGQDEAPQRVAVTPPDLVPPVAPQPAPVNVRVHTDVPGAELFVDGESRGSFPDNGEQKLQLAPGAYRLEVRSGGNAVASELVTVEPGPAVDVSLRLPAGTTQVVAPPDEPVVREFGGVSTPTGATPRPSPGPSSPTPSPTPVAPGHSGPPPTGRVPNHTIPENPF